MSTESDRQQSIELLVLPVAESCRIINFDAAQFIMVPSKWQAGGPVLVVLGEKPYMTMQVDLRPRIYVQRPEYWGIEVVGCLASIGLPAVTPYVATLCLDGAVGTRGIEVIGANQTERIDVPSPVG